MTGSSPRIQVGGTLIPQQHVYIARPEDELLLELLLDRQFCNVLTSRQMGKSSLMIATAAKLRARGVAVSMFDVAGEIGNEPNQEVAWRTIFEKIATDLGIGGDLDPDRWWESQPEGTNNRMLLRFFRDYVGKSLPGPVVIFFDEIDATLRLPYGDDLFTALRTIYNERATEEAYARLTFCVVGVATPNELVKDPRTTAYNIGTDVQLRDFDADRDDLSPLLAVLAVDEEHARPLLERILYWTGGHPFLTLKLCRELTGRTANDVDAYAEARFSDLAELRKDAHFEQILRFLSERLTEGDAAAAILERVIRGHREPDRPTLAHAQLKLSGLVKPNGRSDLVIRNRIYARLFDRHWLRSLAPRRRLIWLRRYAIGASIVVLLAAGYFLYDRQISRPGTIAEEYGKKLQWAKLLSDAKEYRDILAGVRPDPVTGVTLRGNRKVADANYANTIVRWRAQRHADALDMLRAGEVEKALVLGAYIAAGTGGELDPVFQREYDARGYDRLIATLRSSSPFDPGLAVSADGHEIAVGNVWWREGKDRWEAWSVGEGKGVNAVAFGPAGLYTADDGGAIRTWSPGEAGLARASAIESFDGRALDLAVTPDGAMATIVDDTDAPGRPAIIDVPPLHLTKVSTSRSPTAIAFANDGRTLVVAAGSELIVRSARKSFTSFRLPDRSSFRDVAVSAGGTLAVAEARSVGLFADLSLPRPRIWIEHAPPVRSIAISELLHRLATVSDDGVRIFELPSYRELGLSAGDGRTGAGSDAQAVAFDERGNRLIVRRRDVVQIWSLAGMRQQPKRSRLSEWQRKFALRVNASEEIVPVAQ